MTETANERYLRCEMHAARLRQLDEARQAVVEAARAYSHGGERRPQPDWATGLAILKDAVRALEKLEAEE